MELQKSNLIFARKGSKSPTALSLFCLRVAAALSWSSLGDVCGCATCGDYSYTWLFGSHVMREVAHLTEQQVHRFGELLCSCIPADDNMLITTFQVHQPSSTRVTYTTRRRGSSCSCLHRSASETWGRSLLAERGGGGGGVLKTWRRCYLVPDLVHVLRQDVVHFPPISSQELLLWSRRLLPFITVRRETTDGAALRSPIRVSSNSMAFCSSSFLYRDTMLDSALLSRSRMRLKT